LTRRPLCNNVRQLEEPDFPGLNPKLSLLKSSKQARRAHMKKLMSAIACVTALAFAMPVLAQDEGETPKKAKKTVKKVKKEAKEGAKAEKKEAKEGVKAEKKEKAEKKVKKVKKAKKEEAE
jgi:hypothetical protein